MKKKISFTQALLTAVGCVIGSGIFFRADNILKATQGNAATAVLGWIVLGCTLIFAGQSMAILAGRAKEHGGLVAYFKENYGTKMAFYVGWFQVVLYVPVLIAVLGLVATNFGLQLFGIEGISAEAKYLIIAAVIIVVWFWNVTSTKFAATFSSAATIIKVLPLITIAIMGLVFGKGEMAHLMEGTSNILAGPVVPEGKEAVTGIALFAAPLLSMAFAFDGWFSVGSLSVDMEDPQRELPKVFSLNAVIVTIVYASYFAAVTTFMPAAEIMKVGDGHVGIIANQLFGSVGFTLVLTAVVISVLGTLNGNYMAGIRYVQAMAEEGNMPFANFFKQTHPTYHTAFNGGWFIMPMALVYTVMYYLQEAHGMFSGIGFDDIPIMFMSLFLVLLLVVVVKIGQKENLGVYKTWVAPVIATLGQIFVVFSFITQNPTWILYTVCSLVIIALGIGVKKLGNN